MPRLLKVSGSSLLPYYRDGDFVVVSRIPYLLGDIRKGDIIAFRHEHYGTLIKKVQDVGPNQDEIFVIGTQENSVDSRHFGPITGEHMLGKVIWHIKKPGEGT